MKKIIGFILGFISLLTFISPVYAQTNLPICPPSGSGFEGLCKFGASSFGGIVGTLIQLVLIIAIVVSLFFLIYGGIKWVVSGGDKTAVEAARNHIVAAIVGLAISLLAFFILNIVAGLFGINITSLTLPTLKP